MSIRTLIHSLLFLALVPLAPAQSRRDGKPDLAPPPVVSQTISVLRGEKATIPLGIHGGRGEPLEFIIRTPPSHGRLSQLQSTGLNSATVLYTPFPKNTAQEDRFVYAVRGSQGISAPGAITIRFTEPVVVPAKLKAPFDLEFPTVFPGQRSTVELEIMNEGGSVLEGEVKVPEPWSIEGLKIFRLTGGQHATFTLVISPTQAGVVTGDAVITGTERKVIPLRATATVRLGVTPASLKLAAETGSQTRKGVLAITNHTDEDTTVLVEADPRLLTDRTVKVPAHGTSAVPIFADATTAGSFDDVLKLSSNEWKVSVPVHVVAVGAILKFTGDAVSVTGSTPVSGTAVLENSGGEAITVRLEVGSPFELANRVVAVPPRGSVEIPLTVRKAAPGVFAGSLKAVGEGASASIALKAEITADPQRPASAGVSVAAVTPALHAAGASQPAPAGNAPRDDAPPPIPMNVREIPNALGRFARNVGMNSATLDWPVRIGDGTQLRAEERVLSLSPDGKLQIGWSPLDEVTVARTAGRVSAELRGLTSGTYYAVRIVSGNAASPTVLFTSDFRTVPKKPFYSGSLLTPFLVLTLVALAYAVWLSRRAQQGGKM